jgi:hypothetical protein
VARRASPPPNAARGVQINCPPVDPTTGRREADGPVWVLSGTNGGGTWIYISIYNHGMPVSWWPIPVVPPPGSDWALILTEPFFEHCQMYTIVVESEDSAGNVTTDVCEVHWN